MGTTVRKQVVDDHSDEGEKEDDETPQQLGGGRTVRLENFDWKERAVSEVMQYTTNKVGGLATRTNDDYIENQDDQSNDPSTSTVSQVVVTSRRESVVRNRCGPGEHSEELAKEGRQEYVLHHLGVSCASSVIAK